MNNSELEMSCHSTKHLHALVLLSIPTAIVLVVFVTKML